MKSRLLALMLLFLGCASARADDQKQLTTTKGMPVLVANLVNPNPDCSANSGFVMLPTLAQKPASGTIVLKSAMIEVPSSGKCEVRKVPGIAIIYVPAQNFLGDDRVEVTLTMGDRAVSRQYDIKVHE